MWHTNTDPCFASSDEIDDEEGLEDEEDEGEEDEEELEGEGEEDPEVGCTATHWSVSNKFCDFSWSLYHYFRSRAAIKLI